MKSLGAIKTSLILTICTACQPQAARFSQDESPVHKPSPREWDAIERSVNEVYQAGEFVAKTATIDAKSTFESRMLTLKSSEPKIHTAKQALRDRQEWQFEQGHSGINVQEKFPDRRKGILDLLIVMDTSRSMGAFQERVSRSLDGLLKHLGGIDWQLAVNTMDDRDNYCLQSVDGVNVLKSSDYNDVNKRALVQARFRKLISKTNGSTQEFGIKAATKGIIGDCGNPQIDWKRPDSNIAVLLVSDEMNCGSHETETCPEDPELWGFKDYFLKAAKLTRPHQKVTVHGLLLLKDLRAADDPYCPLSGMGGGVITDPVEYKSLINATNGVFGEICQPDYSEVLEAISKNVSSTFNRSIQLSHEPISGSVSVAIAGHPIKFSRNDRHLTLEPSNHSGDIVVSYRHSPIDIVDQVSLQNVGNLDPSSILVTINNQVLTPSQWQYDEGTASLVFTDTPPESSHIKISFAQKQTLQSAFAIPFDLAGYSLKVTLNSNQTENFGIDTENNIVTFASPPEEGSVITIAAYDEEFTKTNYAFSDLASEKINSITASDTATNEEITVEWNGAEAVFPESAITADRRINVTFDIDRSNFEHSLNLSGNIWGDQIKISTDNPDTTCSRDPEVALPQIKFSCDSDNYGKAFVKYTAVQTINYKYAVPEKPNYRRKMQVFVNGAETKSYLWDGFHVYIENMTLAPADLILIQIRPAISRNR